MTSELQVARLQIEHELISAGLQHESAGHPHPLLRCKQWCHLRLPPETRETRECRYMGARFFEAEDPERSDDERERVVVLSVRFECCASVALTQRVNAH
jgi:hypothetical protein